MTTCIRDQFTQDDELLADNANWSPLAGLAEVIDHAVFVSDSSPSYYEAVYAHALNLDSDEQLVRSRVKFSGDVGSPHIALLSRMETDDAGLVRCYLTRLSPGGAIAIYSQLGGSAALLASASATLSDNDSDIFAIKTRDHDYGTEILVFINDEVTPILTYVDANTQRPKGTLVGFNLFDGTVHHQVSLTEFFAHVLRSSIIRAPQPVPKIRNFGDLVTEACFRVDRAGNSQFNATQMGNFINDALAEIYNRLGFCRWWRTSKTFTTADGISRYELWPFVKLIYDIRDMSVGRTLSKKNLQHVNRTDPLRNFTGTAYRYSESGSGDLMGPVIELNPCPSGQTIILVDFYWRPIPMIELTDIPFFPPDHSEILIVGAMKRACRYDTSQKARIENDQLFQDLMANLLQARREDMKEGERMPTDLELMRAETVSGLGPITRAEQLGF